MQARFGVAALWTHRSDTRRLGVGTVAAVGLHALLFLGALSRPERATEIVRALREVALLTEAPEPLGGAPAGAQGAEREAETPASPTPAPKLAARSRPPRPVTQPIPVSPAPEVLEAEADSSSAATVPAPPPGNSRFAHMVVPGGGYGVHGNGGGGLFGGTRLVGNGPGALKAKICRIAETTRWLRDIHACPAIYEEFLDEINVPPQRFEGGFPGFEDLTEYFAVDIVGVFHVPESGSYRFRLKADDGAQLFIDRQLVIDHDGVHGATSKRGEVELDAGRHGIRVWYFQGMKYELALQLFVTPPGGAERLFSSGL
jgi:hypothetical protein